MVGRLLLVLVVALTLLAALPAVGATHPALPVVGCRTEDAQTDSSGHDRGLPRNLPKTLAAPSGLSSIERSRLAWYEGIQRVNGQFRLLGPRGWTCSAVLANDGNWTMRLVPEGRTPTEEGRTGGLWGYQAVGIACAYFPAARRSYDQPGLCKPPPRARVTIRSRHLATVVTSPAGRWTPFPSVAYVLWYTRAPVAETTLADCVLAPAD